MALRRHWSFGFRAARVVLGIAALSAPAFAQALAQAAPPATPAAPAPAPAPAPAACACCAHARCTRNRGADNCCSGRPRRAAPYSGGLTTRASAARRSGCGGFRSRCSAACRRGLVRLVRRSLVRRRVLQLELQLAEAAIGSQRRDSRVRLRQRLLAGLGGDRRLAHRRSHRRSLVASLRSGCAALQFELPGWRCQVRRGIRARKREASLCLLAPGWRGQQSDLGFR